MSEVKLSAELNYAKEFAEVSYTEWKELVEKELKGASFEKKLLTGTYEGINLKPIYVMEDVRGLSIDQGLPGFNPFIRSNRTSGYLKEDWEIAQEIDEKDLLKFNAKLKDYLLRGQNSIVIKIAEKRNNEGIQLKTVNDFGIIFNGIDLYRFPVNFNSELSGTKILKLFLSYLEQNKIDSKKLKGSISFFPIGYGLQNGIIPGGKETVLKDLLELFDLGGKHFPGFKLLNISGVPFNNAGASSTQEIAYILACAVQYIETLLDKGLHIDSIAKIIRVTTAIGPNFFMEIAKLRALRYLWSKIIKAYGGNEESGRLFINARTSEFSMTVTDAYVNMLRATTETFSAILGGVESIQTLPFDFIYSDGDEFSERIARNTQIVLKEESNLHKVIDPAGGSYYIETLTENFVDTSWNYFIDIDSRGGILECLLTGYIQEEVKKVSLQRKKDYAKRKNLIVGTNAYSNIKENLSEHKIRRNVKSDHENEDGIKFSPLENFRISEIFEELRLRAEKIKINNGFLPKVFLFTTGPLSQYKPRADFSKGFFEVGGFDVVYPPGFMKIDVGTDELIKSGSLITVICSTDDTYPELVPGIIESIKEKNNKIKIILAGYPKDIIEDMKKAGIDDFIYLGADLVNMMDKFLKIYEMGE